MVEQLSASCVTFCREDTWKYALGFLWNLSHTPFPFADCVLCPVSLGESMLHPVSLSDPGAGHRDPKHSSENLTHVGEKAQSLKVCPKIFLMEMSILHHFLPKYCFILVLSLGNMFVIYLSRHFGHLQISVWIHFLFSPPIGTEEYKRKRLNTACSLSHMHIHTCTHFPLTYYSNNQKSIRIRILLIDWSRGTIGSHLEMLCELVK